MNAQVDVMLSVLSIGACYAGRTYEYYSPLSPDWHSSAGSSRPEPGLHCNPGRLRYQCNPLHCNPFSPLTCIPARGILVCGVWGHFFIFGIPPLLTRDGTRDP